jgi:tetratricopeptide (TPR) repeat protein
VSDPPNPIDEFCWRTFVEKPLSFLMILLLAAPSISIAQQTKSTWLSEADQARLEALRASGFTALFNLDYDKARKDFTEVARLFPGHPAGPQFLAAGLWIKTLYETRRLQSTLYSSASFYSQNEDKVDPRIVEQFRAWTREAKRLGEARLKQNPKDVEALYYLGMTAGLKASFEEAVERRHFAALRDGSDGVDRHREVIKLDPNFHDAEISIGLYDYVVGSLPLPIKIIAGITGFRGSKKRGLATIERVAKEGHWVRDDAKTLLIVLYTREKRFSDAAAVARELRAKYPRNYLFKLEGADALVAQAALERDKKHAAAVANAEREAFEVFEDLLRDRSMRNSAALDLIHFKYGEALFTAGQAERAAREFLAVTRVERAEQGLMTMAHLYAARAYDVAGKREEALAQYREVLSRSNVYNAHEEAKKGMRQPYKMENLGSNGME